MTDKPKIEPRYPPSSYHLNVVEGQDAYPDGFHFTWNDEILGRDGKHVYNGFHAELAKMMAEQLGIYSNADDDSVSEDGGDDVAMPDNQLSA
jgi:hypothetical protein